MNVPHVAITGSSGFVGSALTTELQKQGYRVTKLVRSVPQNVDEVRWSHEGIESDERLNGLDAVIHLAGKGVAERRWSESVKQEIEASRVAGTRAVVRALGSLPQPPRSFLCASGVGYYGDRKDEVLIETSAPGTTFLSRVCQNWESEAQQAQGYCRVVQFRIGMVLGRGGALSRMTPFFRYGLGGRLGAGSQFVSWISITDLVRAIEHAIRSPTLHGAVNAVGPAPATNAEFARALARHLHRPAAAFVPKFALRLAYGEFAEELLGGQRAQPRKLLEDGFVFEHQTLDAALAALDAL